VARPRVDRTNERAHVQARRIIGVGVSERDAAAVTLAVLVAVAGARSAATLFVLPRSASATRRKTA
jgi:hypothetical protein